jgi:hypothetical protein
MPFTKKTFKKKSKVKKPKGRAPNPRLKPVVRPLTGEAPATPMPIPGISGTNGGTD